MGLFLPTILSRPSGCFRTAGDYDCALDWLSLSVFLVCFPCLKHVHISDVKPCSDSFGHLSFADHPLKSLPRACSQIWYRATRCPRPPPPPPGRVAAARRQQKRGRWRRRARLWKWKRRQRGWGRWWGWGRWMGGGASAGLHDAERLLLRVRDKRNPRGGLHSHIASLHRQALSALPPLPPLVTVPHLWRRGKVRLLPLPHQD